MPTRHHLAESHVETAALEWFRELGYEVRFGPDIAPGEVAAERESCREVVLAGRLWDALGRLNPELPAEAREEAFRRVTRLAAPSLELTNQAFHQLHVEGVPVEYRAGDRVGHGLARLADFHDPAAKESVRANLRRLVRRILRRYNYPPDKQEQATRTVLEQAEELRADWVA